MAVRLDKNFKAYHPFSNYPYFHGSQANICVPNLNSGEMKQLENFDKRLIEMICNLVSSSSFDRMSLQDCNNILKNSIYNKANCL